MTVTITIDGIETTVDFAPYGDIQKADQFVNANIVPVAHMALNRFILERKREISLAESFRKGTR